MLKIVICGKSGCGKSTAVKILKDLLAKRNLITSVLKLAQPLYEIQEEFYKRAGVHKDFYDQDQLLLIDIASHLRRISKTSIINEFCNKLETIQADVVLNDDLRDYETDYPILMEEGFIIIKLVCDDYTREIRQIKRKDITSCVHCKVEDDIDRFEAHYQVDTTSGNLELLREVLDNILHRLLDGSGEL